MDERFEDHPPPGDRPPGGKPPRRAPLPVGPTAAEVWQTFRALARHLPTVALVPFSATFLSQGAVTLWLVDGWGGPGEGPPQISPLILLPLLVMLAAYTMFLVDWHRLVLHGPGPDTTRPRLRLTRRDLRFFGYALLVGILALVAALPILVVAPVLGGSMAGQVVLMLLGLLLNLTVFMACGLVLPAVATGRNYGIGASFEATKDVLLQIAGLVALVILPAALIATGVAQVYVLLAGRGGPIVPGLLIDLVIEYAVMALAATLLSVIFRKRAGIDTKA